jgi:hypothetical protein
VATGRTGTELANAIARRARAVVRRRRMALGRAGRRKRPLPEPTSTTLRGA